MIVVMGALGGAWFVAKLVLVAFDPWDPSKVCREHDDTKLVPCPHCGFVRKKMPEWATFGAVFGLGGKVYRIVSVGSTNRRTSFNSHFEEHAHCELVEGDPWALPGEGVTVGDMSRSLARLFAMPQFYVEQLETAIRMVRP